MSRRDDAPHHAHDHEHENASERITDQPSPENASQERVWPLKKDLERGAKRFASALEYRNWSASYYAKFVGSTTRTVEGWLNAQTRPSQKRIEEMHDLLGVPVNLWGPKRTISEKMKEGRERYLEAAKEKLRPSWHRRHLVLDHQERYSLPVYPWYSEENQAQLRAALAAEKKQKKQMKQTRTVLKERIAARKKKR